MSMGLQMSVERDALVATVAGRFSLEESKRLFVEILETAAHNKASKVLIDGRAIEGGAEVSERFYFHEFAARVVADLTLRGFFQPPPRIAYVLKEPLRDPQGFGEVVANNRGMFVKVSGKFEEAREWLGLPSGEVLGFSRGESRRCAETDEHAR